LIWQYQRLSANESLYLLELPGSPEKIGVS
jgi:hypothetical protein